MITTGIFTSHTAESFLKKALEIFRFQYEHVEPYRRFCQYLKVAPEAVHTLEAIPFLPIELFKQHTIIAHASPVSAQAVFTSSGTTGSSTSKHYVKDLQVYKESFNKAFQQFYGVPQNFTILALLPSYLEREGSSLIYMVDDLISQSNNPHSGFYLNDLQGLIKKIHFLEAQQQKTILLGVSYALLDLIELQKFKLKHTIVMETGGMKGRRKEIVKEELHQHLKEGFGVQHIHSEYGMTELLSQAYSHGAGKYRCPPWMKILTRDPEDALTYIYNKTGGINVIDLANVYSCSFIATQDLGKNYTDGTFEIIGRFDTSDIRGCNLMVL